MPIGAEFLGDGWRTADVPGVGQLEVRRPTMRDIVSQGGNPYWWLTCVRCIDGTPLLPPGVSAADLDLSVGNAIVAEIMQDRPTAGSNAESGG